jgi:hypothetical protein
MTEEEIKLRTKFYLAPASTSIDELRRMDKEYTSYPGATYEQAVELGRKVLDFKNSLDPDGVKIVRS